VSESRGHTASVDLLSGSQFHAIVGAEGIAVFDCSGGSVNVDVSSAFSTVVMNASSYWLVVLGTGAAVDASTVSNVRVAVHSGAVSTTATVPGVTVLVGGIGVTAWNSAITTLSLFGGDGLQTTTSMSGAGSGSGIVGGNGFAGTYAGTILSGQLSYTFCSSQVSVRCRPFPGRP